MVLVSVNLLAGVWPQTMRLRRGRGYAPTNNTRLAKITMRKSIPGFLFFFTYMVWRPFRPRELRY